MNTIKFGKYLFKFSLKQEKVDKAKINWRPRAAVGSGGADEIKNSEVFCWRRGEKCTVVGSCSSAICN